MIVRKTQMTLNIFELKLITSWSHLIEEDSRYKDLVIEKFLSMPL